MFQKFKENLPEPKPFQWVGMVLGLILIVAIWISYTPDPLPSLVDADGDGYVLQDYEGKAIDCKDDDPNIHPNAIDFPEDGIDQDCKDGDEQLDVGGLEGKTLNLFKNFVLSGEVTSKRIVENSRQVRVIGELETALLKIRASTTEYNGDDLREHTVYFYLDSGQNGGHVDLVYDDSGIVSGVFREIDGEPPQFEGTYDLSGLPLGQLNSRETRNLNVIKILNQEGVHYIGAFVSTGIYGILNEMSIEYGCAYESDCRIELVR